MYSTVLFDIDNTLVDSATIATAALQNVMKRHGFDKSFDEIRRLIGVPTEQILKEIGIDYSTDMLDEFKVELQRHKDELKLFSGISDVLMELQEKKLKIGVVTSRTCGEVQSDLSNFEEISNCKILVTSDDTKNPKPSGEPLVFALHKYDLIKSRTLYVGDTLFDLESAKNAGIDFANASWGSLKSVDFGDADYILKYPIELLKVLSL